MLLSVLGLVKEVYCTGLTVRQIVDKFALVCRSYFTGSIPKGQLYESYKSSQHCIGVLAISRVYFGTLLGFIGAVTRLAGAPVAVNSSYGGVGVSALNLGHQHHPAESVDAIIELLKQEVEPCNSQALLIAYLST